MSNFLLIIFTFIFGYFIINDLYQVNHSLAEFKTTANISYFLQALVKLSVAVIETFAILIVWVINLNISVKGIGDKIEKQTYLLGQSTERATS